MRMAELLLLGFGLATSVAACGCDGESAASGASLPDAGAQDGAVADTTDQSDASDGSDASDPPDTSLPDAGSDGGGPDVSVEDAGLPDTGFDAGPWGGKTIDEPFTVDQIELADTATQSGFRAEFYRNKAYTCGLSGWQTFVIVYPAGLGAGEERPLWVRLHGGGVGAFASDGSYVPPNFYPDSIDEEQFTSLGNLANETGLVAKVRNHTAGFRFLMPSMCDHDVYSGVGVPEPNNPNSPDENGKTRAADGLLATKAAIAFTRQKYATAHTFLHGTSAGSIGCFSVAYSFERAGLSLSGIVMDSHVFSEAFKEIIAAGCTAYDSQLVAAKVGPMTDQENIPDRVVSRGDIDVPIMHVWSRGDGSCCGETPITFTDDQGQEQTMGMCDYHHEALRKAIAAAPPGGSSENLRMCVNAPGSGGGCNMHSPTKIDYAEPDPDGDLDHGNRDYNQYIIDWVTQRLSGPKP
ncbi:MAG: hypothetical protein HY897_21045 [Deltaproteobacteria bacterium]|nr:hypothetical protein [Deltaproteobacteria bacterium]